MSHNEKLRLEVFVYDEHDVKRIDNSTWDKISINKISLLREEYKKEIERNSRLWNLMNILNVNDKEIDQLVSFLESLTGRSGNQRPLGKPHKVPSGLSID